MTSEHGTPGTLSGVVSASLTAREAAGLAGVHERTILRAIKAGKLPAVKHAGAYAIDPAELAAWQTRHTTPDTRHQTRDSEQDTTPDSVSRVVRSAVGGDRLREVETALAVERERVAGLERLLAERGERVTQLETALAAERDAGEQLRILVRDSLGERGLPATVEAVRRRQDAPVDSPAGPGSKEAAAVSDESSHAESWLLTVARKLLRRS